MKRGKTTMQSRFVREMILCCVWCRFICSNKAEEVKKIKKLDRQKEISTRRQVDKEKEEIRFYKTKYHEKLSNYLKIAEAQQTLPIRIPIFHEAQAVQMLKKELGESD